MTAWHRKALERPAPWARAMRPIETETLVTFYRPGASVEDGFGGWSVGEDAQFSIVVHLEMQRDSQPTGSGGEPGDTLRKRRWVMYVPLPLDPEMIPRTGDRVAFRDQLDRPYDVPVRTAPWVPDGLADHLVVTTEDLE